VGDRGGHAGDRDALLTPALAGNDPDRAPWDAETLCEQIDERVVRRAFDRRGRETHHQRVFSRAGDFGFSRARDDSNDEEYSTRSV